MADWWYYQMIFVYKVSTRDVTIHFSHSLVRFTTRCISLDVDTYHYTRSSFDEVYRDEVLAQNAGEKEIEIHIYKLTLTFFIKK